ncbi:unnamed protein product [Gadus morhua 'NCC']
MIGLTHLTLGVDSEARGLAAVWVLLSGNTSSDPLADLEATPLGLILRDDEHTPSFKPLSANPCHSVPSQGPSKALIMNPSNTTTISTTPSSTTSTTTATSSTTTSYTTSTLSSAKTTQDHLHHHF